MDLENSFARTYGVEILLSQPPTLSKSSLLQSFQKHCGRVESPGDKEETSGGVFFHLDHSVQYGDSSVPAQTFLAFSETSPDLDKLEAAIQQSWDWPEAANRVESARHTLLVSDMMAAGLDHKERLSLFHNALLAVLDHVEPLALHWQRSQRIVDPEAYLRSKQADNFDAIFPAINVRLFNIQNRRPDETLMDTVGLSALGLPDLQCHFVNLDVNRVASLLFNTAYYLFEKGDIIQDGETVEGMQQGQKWKCQHERSLVDPQREVMDINPGKPYAAGNRSEETSRPQRGWRSLFRNEQN